MVAARAVDQNRDRAERRLDLRVGRLEALLFQRVAGHGHRLAARRRDLVRDALRGLQLEVGHGHRRAALGQGLGHRAAQHAAAAGHHRHLAVQIHLKGN